MDKVAVNSRNKGLDLYRIIACAFVIINHCNSKVLIQLEPGSCSWLISVGTVFVTKICVPGFFMITGYNLLHRTENFGTYVRRIVRVLGCLIVFSLFYYIWRCAIHTMPVDIPQNAGMGAAAGAYIGGFFRILISGGATDAFWYLYTYLGLLIVMPALQLLAGVCKPGRRLFIIAGLIWAYISLIPSVSILIPDIALSPDFEIPVVTCGVMYMLFGHIFYLYRHRLGVGSGSGSGGAVALCIYFAGFLLSACLAYTEYTITDGASFLSFSDIHTAGMTVMSVAAFALFLKIRGGRFTELLVHRVSPATFGMYLVADFVCSNTHMIYYELCRYMNRLAAVAIQDAVAFLAAFVLVYLLRMIPGVSKWI